MIRAQITGSTDKTEKFLKRAATLDLSNLLDKYGKAGVAALAAATPVDQGTTAAAWTYSIVRSRGTASIIWENTHVVDGRPIAILLQYGHGTRNGGYVQGRDYINPALKPIFDKMADEAWKAVVAL
jgi:hypothetical protein